MKEDLDTKLYNDYLNGDENAFELLYNRYKSKIQYFIFNIIKDYEKAEDITQEVFLYIFQNNSKIECSFKYYIYLISKSRAFTYINKETRRTEIVEEYITSNNEIHEDVLETIVRNENKKEILNALNKLDDKYKNVLYLVMIEGLSYKETSKILGETMPNTKSLIHRGKKQLRAILVKKGFDAEMKKISKLLLSVVLVIILATGITYAAIKVYKRIQGQASLSPIFTEKLGDTNMNNIWVGSFQIAWNEFCETIGGDIVFEDGNSTLVDELNKKYFTKENLSEEDYYINIGKISPELKNKIIKDLNDKFNLNRSIILDKIDFNNSINNGYTIYSILIKNFEFKIPFDKLGGFRFGDYEDKVEYFGINNASDEDLNNNVEVLFYDSNEFAVKLLTKENEEVILYKTDNSSSFSKTYENLIEKSNKYNGNKTFSKTDELKVPYINVDTIINYDDLCGKYIKDTNGMYISNAFQNVIFNLNEVGCNLISESGIKSEYIIENENTRYFYYNDNFIVFIKEQDKDLPYFSLVVNNLDTLELEVLSN